MTHAAGERNAAQTSMNHPEIGMGADEVGAGAGMVLGRRARGPYPATVRCNHAPRTCSKLLHM